MQVRLTPKNTLAVLKVAKRDSSSAARILNLIVSLHFTRRNSKKK